MPKGSRTSMFVSSTCYDLAQLRVDLRDFAEGAGLEPILSEFGSFPVNPSQVAVANCLEVVRARTDLFVLVVGGRYGSINDTGKSITNLEYLEAAARGIPRYVFVRHEILSLLPVWRANPEADFRSTVDTSKLFEFVCNLREKDQVWVFPFATAQDIVRTLRDQLSYLFADCLAMRSKMQGADLTTLRLGPEALQIFVEKPRGWEYLVFAKLLQERVRSLRGKRFDAELGISFGRVVDLSDRAAAVNWVSAKFSQMAKITETLNLAMSAGMEKAVGRPGEPGDIERIEHLASRIADGYEQALEWTLEFRRLAVEPSLERLMQLASNFSAGMLTEMYDFAEGLYERVRQAIASDSPGEFTLTLSTPDSAAFFEEMRKVALR